MWDRNVVATVVITAITCCLVVAWDILTLCRIEGLLDRLIVGGQI